MYADEEGFLYPEISQEKCVHCNRCKDVCPILHKPDNYSLELAFGCYAQNEEERMSSSSGGFFSVLARAVLSDGGVVCGAAYDKDMVVKHVIVDDDKELYKIKGTKYVQSRIGDTYSRLRGYLQEGKRVLFSGTPCQVAGFKAYLGKEYENLISVDLICHGVPSPAVFQRYLKEVSVDQKVVNMTFRNKQNGMKNVTVDFELEYGDTIAQRYSECPYTIGFIKNLYIRPSCFECKFKGKERCSDITIGDFWSIKEYHPNFSDDYGTSAIIVHSQKGKNILDEINQQLIKTKATADEIACWNECLLTSITKNENRTKFFEIWNYMTIKEAVEKLKGNVQTENKTKKVDLFKRVKGKIKKWLV